MRAFKGFFLTSLGNEFLETYYKSCLKDNETISIIAVNENSDITGFCIGCMKSKGFHKKLIKRNMLPFFFQGIKALINNPKTIIRLVRNLDKNSTSTDDGNYNELLSIAVSPASKSMGVGKELILKYEEEAIKRQCKKIALTTDYYNNDDVIGFYKKMGYTPLCDFISYPNRRMYKLIKEII